MKAPLGHGDLKREKIVLFGKRVHLGKSPELQGRNSMRRVGNMCCAGEK